MCQEFHCECCSDDLPQITCVCVDCYHGDEESDAMMDSRANEDKSVMENNLCDLEKIYGQKSHPEQRNCIKDAEVELNNSNESCCERKKWDKEAKNLEDECCLLESGGDNCSQINPQEKPMTASFDSINAKPAISDTCGKIRAKKSSKEDTKSIIPCKEEYNGKKSLSKNRDKCCNSEEKNCNEEIKPNQLENKCCATEKGAKERPPSGCSNQDQPSAFADVEGSKSCYTASGSSSSCQKDLLENTENNCCSGHQSKQQCNSKADEEIKKSYSAKNKHSSCNKEQGNGKQIIKSGSYSSTSNAKSTADNAKKHTACSASGGGTCCSEEVDLRNDESCTKEETIHLIGSTEEERTTQPKNTRPNILSLRNTTKLRVQNICCAMEANLVEECFKPLKGIESVAVNVIGRVVHVRHNPEVTSPTELVDCLNKVHLGATVMEIGAHRDHGDEQIPRKLILNIIYVLVQVVLFGTAVSGLFLEEAWYQWVAIAEIIFGGVPILKNSYYAVKNRKVDINILMLIAIIGTLAISEWVEGATVVFVFAVADVLQEFCMFRVQRTISRLMLKRPEIAVLVETGEKVSIESVPIGSLIAVRPGELIPLDGIIVKGRATVDESSITGEALPVEKTVMSNVFSGTVNQNGYIEVETTSDSSSSTVSKVAQLVQEAQSSPTVTEVIINRFAKFYTPLVVTIAALLVIIPAILGAAGVGTYLQDIREWGRRALVMLVISCPCALVMATPIAIVCSITAAARKGALVKGGAFLETLSKLQVLAFDKTGTLTEGKFQVTNMECANGENERDVLRLAAGLESKTVHPISAAIVSEFSGCVAKMVKKQTVNLPEVTQFTMYEGQGISGFIEGKRVRVGNKDMLHDCGAVLSEYMCNKYQVWSSESKTVVFVCIDEKISLMIALADEIRPNTNISLDWLSTIGVQTSMITGDNKRTAEAVKTKLTLDECVSEMKPHDKLQWIKDKQTIKMHENTNKLLVCCKKTPNNYLIVGMVGDGVNDGPALASANVGIAMGAGGTALAVEAADVALMSNNLAKIPELITLSRFCNRIIKQNISTSVLLKIAIAIVAFSGYVTLWMAVVADVVALLVVILNGLRPLYWKPSKSHRKAPLDVESGLKWNAYNYESM